MEISVIAPVYNEEENINRLIENVEKVLKQNFKSYEILLVNDGSTDNTLEMINEFISTSKQKNLAVINYVHNTGKANTIYNSVKNLLENTELDYIGYLDADFATNVDEFSKMINSLNNNQLEFIIASRVNLLNSNIKRKYYRHLIGRLIVTIINLKYHLGVYDTQCGAKIFSREIISIGFRSSFHTSWLFDIELFIRLRTEHLLRYGTEFPIKNWRDIEGSKLKTTHIFLILKELLTLYKFYK